MPITIGSGAITGLSAGGLPDASITQADLAANVAGNGPCFSAYQNAVATSLVSAVYTKIALQSKDFDIGGYFDNATNYRFQPLVAGYYQINGAFLLAAPAPVLFATIYKNGAAYCRGAQSGSSAGTAYGSSVSALILLNGSTDYIELWGYQASGGTLSTDAATAYRANRLDGNLVRAA